MKYAVEELLKDHQTGHSEFQDDYLITVRAGGDTYGQYKQALRELHRRETGLREIEFSIEILEIDIDELDGKSPANEYDSRRNAVELRKKTMQLEEAQRVYRDTKREFDRFWHQACQLKDEIGELTDEKRNKLDRDMWLNKVKSMIAIDLVCNGRPSQGTYEFVASLPKGMKREVLSSIQNHKNLIEWFESFHNDHGFNLPSLEGGNETLISDI